MQVEHTAPVSYTLPLGDASVPMNPLLGKQIKLEFNGEINCIHCRRKTSKSFQQGFCYPCTQQLAQCDICILKPELCHFHKGTCREPGWGEQHCMIDHFVYLAVSSGLKVGITRHTQIPTRWIDQGAVSAIPLARVASRFDSGKVEVALKEYFQDKTNWRNMLKNIFPEVDPADEKTKIVPVLDKILGKLETTEILDSQVYTFEYPVLEYPSKINSLSFDKQPLVEGTLMGIKGQYLLLDTGVINIRKYGGYRITLSY